jgi:uncharacterized Zn finger protein
MARRSSRYAFDYGYGGFPPHVTVGERRAQADKRIAALTKKGRTLSPVRLETSAIAKTFWGKAWCKNLESYSDFSNRLPRGRSYVRSGAVIDLQIGAGSITALVEGSSLYEIAIGIDALPAPRWAALRTACAGQIDSMVALLQGTIATPVIALVTDHEKGLFPSPKQIRMNCSCPDGAYMCKHLAAALYGVGARLDEKPDLFFVLRKVDPMDLLSGLGAKAEARAKPKKALRASDLSDVFGIELDEPQKASKKKAAPRR